LAKSTVVDDELEPIVHESTVTSAVLFVAVNEFLFRQDVKTTTSDGNSAFDGSSGGEGPA